MTLTSKQLKSNVFSFFISFSVLSKFVSVTKFAHFDLALKTSAGKALNSEVVINLS